MSMQIAADPADPSGQDTGRRTRAEWMVLLAAFLGWMFDGLEMGIFPLVARPALQDLLGVTSDMDVGRWMGIITALFLIGAAVGGVIFGWLGDRIGRVRAMSLSILTYSLFTGLAYFVAEPWHLGACRFIAALGMGGEWSLGVALVMEIWPQKHRPLLAGVIGAAANVGFALIAVISRFIPVTRDSWRWVMLAGAVPALLVFFIRLFVPESERWKAASKKRNQDEETLHVLLYDWPLFVKTMLAISFASIALIGTWGSVQWLPLWADQLTGGQVPSAKANTQIMSALGAVVGCFIGPWIGGRMGRRPAYFILCLASLILCAVLFRTISAYNTMFLVSTALVGCVTAAFYGWFPLYLPELFPTRVRATGQGLSYNSGRVLAAVGALQMGALMSHYQGSYAKAGATITLVYALGLFLIWLAPETKGKELPD